MRIRLEFKLEDMWIGVFWKHGTWEDDGGRDPAIDGDYWSRLKTYATLDIWICLVPCFPIHISLDTPVP